MGASQGWEGALVVAFTLASQEACRHCPMTAAARSASVPVASPATQGSLVVVASPVGPLLWFVLRWPSRPAAVAAAARGEEGAAEPQQVVASSATAPAAGGSGGEDECHSCPRVAWSVLCHCWGARGGLCTPLPQPGGPSFAAACSRRGTRPGLPASCVNFPLRHCLGNLGEDEGRMGAD